MGNWMELLDGCDNHDIHKIHFAKKPDKGVFCRKNKLGGGKYGYHEYEGESNRCKNCGHTKKNPKMFNSSDID